MTCTRFELGARGSLAIVREAHTLICLWADEVDRLRELLARPTPAEVVNVSISKDNALPAAARLLPDGGVYIAFEFTVQAFEGVGLDAKHTNQLRYALGVFATRDDEPVDALAQSALESWGPEHERMEAVTERAAAASRPAAREEPRWNV